jgi:hypothetical protein
MTALMKKLKDLIYNYLAKDSDSNFEELSQIHNFVKSDVQASVNLLTHFAEKNLKYSSELEELYSRPTFSDKIDLPEYNKEEYLLEESHMMIVLTSDKKKMVVSRIFREVNKSGYFYSFRGTIGEDKVVVKTTPDENGVRAVSYYCIKFPTIN